MARAFVCILSILASFVLLQPADAQPLGVEIRMFTDVSLPADAATIEAAFLARLEKARAFCEKLGGRFDGLTSTTPRVEISGATLTIRFAINCVFPDRETYVRSGQRFEYGQ